MEKKDDLALTNTVNDKERKIAELEDKVSALENALKEKEECEDCMAVRKQLIECWEYSDGIVGLKRMGEINVSRFYTAVEKRLMWNDLDAETEELWWFWQNKLSDPHWHPFKMVPVNGTNDHQKAVDPEDGYLKMLRIHLGGEACDLVISTLKEMLEYNPIMRTPVPELWNFAENRKATLKEAIYNVEFQGQRKRFRAGGGVIYSH